jgi:mono/diheme cytochrome c family protein
MRVLNSWVLGFMATAIVLAVPPVRAEEKPPADPDPKAIQAEAQAKAIDALVQSIEQLRATGLSTPELVARLKAESDKSQAALAAAQKTAAEQATALEEKKKAFEKLSQDATALREQLKKIETDLANGKMEADALDKSVKDSQAAAAAAQKRLDSLGATIQLLEKIGDLSVSPKTEAPPKIETPVKIVSAKVTLTPEQAELAKQAFAVLETNCLKCHGNGIIKSGLDMRTRETALAGGDRGPALVPGKPEMSQLLKSVRHSDQPHMPPKKKLKDDEIEVLTKWVASGGHWPGAGAIQTAGTGDAAKPEAAAAVGVPGDDLAKLAIGVLEQNCFRCHGEEKQKGELDLRLRASVLKGGETGPALVPGKPEESLLFKAITKQVEPNMPPKKDLPAESIEILKKWIAAGANWPGDQKVEAKAAAATTTTTKAKEYWWQAPVVRREAPQVKNSAWVQNPIDAFVLSGLEKAGLSPAPAASQGHLLRRVYFDLIGLPPTPEEVADFTADTSPNAYEKVIDRLLASPQYGERWGRHWLDLVRYAETHGYERDSSKPNAWRYRDYVIRSFNANKPYDQFVREQLAGDELDKPTFEAKVATGFYRLGAWDDEPDDKKTARYDELDDIIRTSTSAFLGLTVNCARCHDHKFDAIPQLEYYRLLAFFHGVKHKDDVPLVPQEEVDRYNAAMAAVDQRVKDLNATIAEVEKPARDQLFAGKLAELPQELREAYALPPDQRNDAQKKLAEDAQQQAQPNPQEVAKAMSEDATKKKAELDEQIKLANASRPGQYPMAMGIAENPKESPKTHILARGDAHTPGEEVEPGFLTVLASAKLSPTPKPEAGETLGRRRVLADWIASDDNQLTARVMANRLWQHHFGRGIVRSASDFGTMGDPPTHPELLDWLAADLVDNGWRLKSLHHKIMTSNAYRMASTNDAKALASDPENDLFWRQELRRLEAEAIRDSVLAVTGGLNSTMGGPSIYPTISKAVLHGQSQPGNGWGNSSPADAARRSVYIFVKRSLVVPMMETFDFADTGQSCAQRNVTTIAPQALTMMNGEFMHEQARVLADRLLREAGSEPVNQVKLAYRLAFARDPEADELATAVGLIQKQRDNVKKTVPKDKPLSAEEIDRRALASFGLVMLNLNEFVYVD